MLFCVQKVRLGAQTPGVAAGSGCGGAPWVSYKGTLGRGGGGPVPSHDPAPAVPAPGPALWWAGRGCRRGVAGLGWWEWRTQTSQVSGPSCSPSAHRLWHEVRLRAAPL